MYCRKCGIELRPDWKICPNCGVRIEKNLRQPIMPEQILLTTTGGMNPDSFGSWRSYMGFGFSFLIGLLALSMSFQINDEEKRNYLLILGMIVLFSGLFSFAVGRMKSLASRRIDKGRLVITNLAVEGLSAAERD